LAINLEDENVWQQWQPGQQVSQAPQPQQPVPSPAPRAASCAEELLM